MLACDICMSDIENKELDIINPDDHPVSMKLRNIICNWLDMNHWCCVGTNIYFCEYNIIYNHCYVCSKNIDNIEGMDIAIATGGGAFAHYECANSKGFRNYFSKKSYNEILDNLESEDNINALDKTPYYVPPFSNSDKEKLSHIMQSVQLQSLTDTHINRIFFYLNVKYWKPINQRSGCTFCRFQCHYHNERLNLFSCSKCLDIIAKQNI